MADLGIARLNSDADAHATLTRADLADVVHRKLGPVARRKRQPGRARAAPHVPFAVRRAERQDFGLRHLHPARQGRARRPQSQDRGRSADRAAPGDDLPRQPDHARPDRAGLIRVAAGDKDPGRASDHRRIVERAWRRAAHPALLGNPIPPAEADAARRQPPLLPARRRRAGAADPPPAQRRRLYRPRGPETARATSDVPRPSRSRRSPRPRASRAPDAQFTPSREVPSVDVVPADRASATASPPRSATRPPSLLRTRAIARSSGTRRTATSGGKALSSRDGKAADRITNMPAVALAADQPPERLRQPRADHAVVIGAAAAGHPPRRVKHGRPRPRHPLHHHQPQRIRRARRPRRAARRCRAGWRADRRGRCRPGCRRRSDRHAGRRAAGPRARAGRRSARGPPSAAGWR